MKIHNFTVCDQVRREDNGKFIIIGAYANEILFHSLPSTFNFTIWFLLEHERTGADRFTVRGRIDQLEEPVLKVEGETEVADIKQWDPIGIMSSLNLDGPCTLFLEAKLEDGEWFLLREIRVSKGNVAIPEILPKPASMG
ncbi:hypothetical protein [Rhizobium sp. BK068]|uniref:DUF6941 family protein n=1 Tax=Rhizobium sp. BK068 TaxID=2512130 RepID=UPI00104FEEDD|nr:hypothetical protein [Rhizobium sp. BK068]TCM78619.1 hypothetical protein EV291_105241 [Rhizobium sp. BK068]